MKTYVRGWVFIRILEKHSLLMRKTRGSLLKGGHRSSPDGEASAFYPGTFVLPGRSVLWTCHALLPKVRLTFHRKRPLNSGICLERAVSLPSPARLKLRRLMLYHLFRVVLFFVSFLYLMDPFKLQSFLSGEGKWGVLDNWDNWKGAIRKEI